MKALASGENWVRKKISEGVISKRGAVLRRVARYSAKFKNGRTIQSTKTSDTCTRRPTHSNETIVCPLLLSPQSPCRMYLVYGKCSRSLTESVVPKKSRPAESASPPPPAGNGVVDGPLEPSGRPPLLPPKALLLYVDLPPSLPSEEVGRALNHGSFREVSPPSSGLTGDVTLN